MPKIPDLEVKIVPRIELPAIWRVYVAITPKVAERFVQLAERAQLEVPDFVEAMLDDEQAHFDEISQLRAQLASLQTRNNTQKEMIEARDELIAEAQQERIQAGVGLQGTVDHYRTLAESLQAQLDERDEPFVTVGEWTTMREQRDGATSACAFLGRTLAKVGERYRQQSDKLELITRDRDACNRMLQDWQARYDEGIGKAFERGKAKMAGEVAGKLHEVADSIHVAANHAAHRATQSEPT